MDDRTLGRQWGTRALALLVLGAALLGTPCSAALYTVTKIDDTADGACTPDDCSLREAIIAANATAAADEITLPAGTYPLTIAGEFEDAAATGDLDITSDLILTGAGADRTIVDGMRSDRVFEVVGGTVTLAGISVQNGRAYLHGGGIANSGGTLTLANCAVERNSVRYSLGLDGGGGLWLVSTTRLLDSTVSDNFVELPFAPNAAARGRYSLDGGGGIEVVGGAIVSLVNCTLAGNSAWSIGGGLFVTYSDVTLTNCTLTGNLARNGGGIGQFAGFGNVTLVNTIVADNPYGGNCSNTSGVQDGGHNLQFPDADCGATIPSLDPLLDPAGLALNGGATQTVALCTGVDQPTGCTGASPAIGAGDATVCSAAPVSGLDQRGFGRPGAGQSACSIGAYEADAVAADPTGTPTAPAAATPTPRASDCVGDCDGDARVAIDELILGVGIVLGTRPADACAALADGQGTVDVARLIQAVNNALNGCR